MIDEQKREELRDLATELAQPIPEPENTRNSTVTLSRGFFQAKTKIAEIQNP